ncbi:MAG TPA: hypothetical protein VJX92_25890 [Methylomirabilota bacterium]|nr:hypothetical protein [Methylomirabilota bacterium]
MTRGPIVLAVTVALPMLAACSLEPARAPAAGRFTLMEHVQVAGSCFEDRGGEAARYTGFLERWRDSKDNRELLHGSVSNFDRPDAAQPMKPRPPASIQFGEVSAERLAADRVVLKGLATGNPPREVTCTLDVTKRQRPADEEGRLAASVLGRAPIPVNARIAVSASALLIGLVAGVRMARYQVRRSAAPWLLGLAFLLQLISLLLP